MDLTGEILNIALISDIHFGAMARTAELAVEGDPPVSTNKGGTSLIESLSAILLEEETEALMVSGDLTSTGCPLELSECYNAIFSIAEKANIDKKNVFLCAGNHDVHWPISNLVKSKEEKSNNASYPYVKLQELYQHISASLCRTDTMGLQNTPFDKPGPLALSGIYDREEYVVFCLNTGSFSNEHENTHHGKVGKAQLEWFEKVGQEYRDRKVWKILVLHHHLYDLEYPVPCRDITLVEDAPSLLRIASDIGVTLVCHGHRHHPRIVTRNESGWGKPITFVCAGSVSVNDAGRDHGDIPNVFHVLKLEKAPVKKDAYQGTVHTYEFTSGGGWNPLRKMTAQTPIDQKHFFADLYTEQDQKETLASVINTIDWAENIGRLTWKDLPPPLKVMQWNKLTALLTSELSDEYDIVGDISSQIVLLPRRISEEIE